MDGWARRRRWFCLAVTAAMLLAGLTRGPVRTSAQDETPEPGQDAVALLPAADAFGPGWKRFVPAAVPNLPAGTFREGATVVYGGPEGARVILTALLVGDGRIRRAWEDAGVLYDNIRYTMSYDYAREEQLRNVPPPPGCAEAKRLEGRDYTDGFEIGLTLCAGDPDLILLAVASGRVNDEIGFAAADNVVEAALSAADGELSEDGDAGTPAASTGRKTYDRG